VGKILYQFCQVGSNDGFMYRPEELFTAN